jgi:flagellar assembly protein FliH
MSSLEAAAVFTWAFPDLHHGDGSPPSESDAPSPADVAFVQGVEEGRQAATEEADQKTLAARQALAGAAESLQAVRAALASEVEEAVYALAVALAQQIIQREVSTDPTIIRDLVRRGLEVLPLEGALEIKLHPADLGALGDHLDLYAPGGRSLDVRWVADTTVGRGGFAIETPQRMVDGRIDPVLLAMYDRLRNG